MGTLTTCLEVYFAEIDEGRLGIPNGSNCKLKAPNPQIYTSIKRSFYMHLLTAVFNT